MQTPRTVLFLDEGHPFLQHRLEELGYRCALHLTAPREEILALLPQVFGIAMRSRLRIDRAFLEQAEHLKFIARAGVGVEHIDLVAAAERGVEVIISPEGSRDTVSEHALGMLLMLLNNLGRADRQVRSGQWVRAGNRGVEIKGKTVGILGYGNMGSGLAQRLQGFGCEVIAYDKFKTDYGDAHAKAVDLATIFAESDILSLHIPYLPENHHLVNAAFLAQFQKPLFLVNTSRGMVLNTAAVVAAMQSGRVLGVALDVYEYEEMSFETLKPLELPEPFQYLRSVDNAVLTPHIAGWSFESNEGHARVLAGKIEAMFGAGGMIK